LQQVAEVERALQQEAAEDQTMTMVPAAVRGTTTELKALPASFDPRGYYQYQQPQHVKASVLGAASAASSSQYSEQPHGQGQQEYHHQTALHLGYHVKIDDSAAGKGFL
jgi:hypothetical protein